MKPTSSCAMHENEAGHSYLRKHEVTNRPRQAFAFSVFWACPADAGRALLPRLRRRHRACIRGLSLSPRRWGVTIPHAILGIAKLAKTNIRHAFGLAFLRFEEGGVAPIPSSTAR